MKLVTSLKAPIFHIAGTSWYRGITYTKIQRTGTDRIVIVTHMFVKLFLLNINPLSLWNTPYHMAVCSTST